MKRVVRIEGHEVVIETDDTVTRIKIDDQNPMYQQIKAETDNFTRNMVQKSALEIMQETIDQLVIDILEGI